LSHLTGSGPDGGAGIVMLEMKLCRIRAARQVPLPQCYNVQIWS